MSKYVHFAITHRLCYKELRKKPVTKVRRGNQVTDEIKLLEQGPDGAEEVDGRPDVAENGAVIIPLQSMVNQAFAASSAEELLEVRAAASLKEAPQPVGIPVIEEGAKQKRKGSTSHADERAPPNAPVEGRERRRSSQTGREEQGVKVRARKEGERAPRAASMGDPRAARRLQQGQERERKTKSVARETTPTKSPQKGTDFNV